MLLHLHFTDKCIEKRAETRESASSCVWNWDYDNSYILYQAELN